MFGFIACARVARMAVLALAMCVGLPVTASIDSPSRPDKLVIGQSAPLSGKNAQFGKDIRRGALAYFNTVNRAGGINGRAIELVTLDDQNEAAQSGKNAKSLVDDPRILALFGFASATLASPALPLIHKEGMAMIAPMTGADTIHRQTANVFTIRASYRDELAVLVDLWKRYLETVVVVHYDDAVGKQNFTTVVEMFKSSGTASATVTSIPIKRNQAIDLNTVERIGTLSPQLILFTTLAEPIRELVMEIKKSQKFYYMASLSFAGNSVLHEALGDAGIGLHMTAVVPQPARYSPLVKEYAAAMVREGFGQNYTSLESFIAAKTLVEGLRRAGAKPTRQSLVRGMENIGRLDLGGYVVNFSPTAHHGSRFVDLVVIGANGQLK